MKIRVFIEPDACNWFDIEAPIANLSQLWGAVIKEDALVCDSFAIPRRNIHHMLQMASETKPNLVLLPGGEGKPN